MGFERQLAAKLDAMEEPQAQPLARLSRDGVEVFNPHPESLAEITVEYPQLQWRYEQYRPLMTDASLVDRRHAQLAVFQAAEKEYEASTGERLAHWQRRLLGRYSRNLALAGNELSAGVFDLTVAARSVVDDNYAWDVWEAAGRYPPQRRHRRHAHGADLRRGDLDGHAAHPPAPPPAEH